MNELDRPVLPARIEKNLVLFKTEDWTDLLQQARANTIGRARVCAHRDSESLVQEMLIAFVKDSYVRPHRHLNKTESFHVVEGELSVIFFDDCGEETDRVALSASDSTKPFYFRGEREQWHTVLVESGHAFIHETTTGPFEHSDKLLAPWAPAQGDRVATEIFLDSLRKIS